MMKELGSKRPRWVRVLRIFLLLILLLVATVMARCLYAFRDRNPGYAVHLERSAAPAQAGPRPLRVGFARQTINPDLSDPKKPIWVAGFSQHRAATKLHDDLWAVGCVLDDGYTRIGIVVLDAIGFFHDDVIAVRRRLGAELKLDYSIVCSTHNHSTPDLMGLWGPNIFRTGVNAAYREQVIATAAKVLGEAVKAIRPAKVSMIELPTPPEGLVTDTRKPEVYDSDLRVMHFTDPTNGVTIGSIVGWANHPETPWGKNTEITADFCGYLRDGLEKGIAENGQILARGLGGTHLFVNGAVGGLMTTHPRVTVQDPYLNRDFQEPSHEKTRALGRQLVSRILPALGQTNASRSEYMPISVQARTIQIPLDNTGFLLAPVLGLIDRGQVKWKTFRSEVALLTLGEASIACVPGEIYPELVNGGVEQPPGADFGIAPLEVPSLREMMPGKIKFLFGLANDEIGYIIPKSEWDREPPYLYGSDRGVYGEVNSTGPETARIIHDAFREMSARSQANR
jgi:hypothetical protein